MSHRYITRAQGRGQMEETFIFFAGLSVFLVFVDSLVYKDVYRVCTNVQLQIISCIRQVKTFVN